MTAEHGRIPPGPEEKYKPSENLLSWMGDQFERFGDIYKASIYGTNAYVTRDPGYAEHVLRDNWRNYVKGQAIKRVALLLGNGLMVSEGEFWKRQRRMIQPTFHRDAIPALTNIITRANAELLKTWEQAAQKSEDVNVTAGISHMILKIVLVSIFGDDYDEVAPQFNVLSEDGARSLEFAQKFRSLGQIILQIAIGRRRQNTISADILGMLMEVRDRDTGLAMPDRQLVNEIMTLIVAGHETTASTLNWIWYLLSQNADAEGKLSSELDNLCEGESLGLENLPKFTYARQVIDEALRMYPAGWLMTRRALKDDQLGDYFVPAGTEIYVPPYFIQRHPKLWEEPDRFNPDRFALSQPQDRHRLAMVPFSAGPRNCIGESLARVEMQIHLMMVAKRLLLRYFEPEPPELDIGVNLRSKHNFIMKPESKALRRNFVQAV
jgi:cytochrome P450